MSINHQNSPHILKLIISFLKNWCRNGTTWICFKESKLKQFQPPPRDQGLFPLPRKPQEPSSFGIELSKHIQTISRCPNNPQSVYQRLNQLQLQKWFLDFVVPLYQAKRRRPHIPPILPPWSVSPADLPMPQRRIGMARWSAQRKVPAVPCPFRVRSWLFRLCWLRLKMLGLKGNG